MGMLPNLKNFANFMFAFFLIYFPFSSMQVLATQSMRINGFGNLGYFSLGIIYLTFALTNIYAKNLIRSFSIYKVMLISSIAESSWILFVALTATNDFIDGQNTMS